MNEFIQKTLTPEVFWSAAAAIGTMLAVIVALFLPILSRYFLSNRIEHLIAADLKRNYEVIKNMTSRDSSTLPDGQTIDAASVINALARHIDLRIWHQYRHNLASDRPKSYAKYHEVYRYAEGILGIETDQTPARNMMKLLMQTDEAKNFVSKYRNLK